MRKLYTVWEKLADGTEVSRYSGSYEICSNIFVEYTRLGFSVEIRDFTY